MGSYERREEPDRRDDEPVDGNCNSKRTNGNGLCRNPAGLRTDHLGIGLCYNHGGAGPGGHVHAERLAATQARAEVHAEIDAALNFGIWDDEIGSADAAAEQLRRARGWVQICEVKLNQLDPDQLHWGKVQQSVKKRLAEAPADLAHAAGDGFVYEMTVLEAAKANAWLEAWFDGQDRLDRAILTAHKVGVEERQTAIMEVNAVELAARMRALVEFLGMATDPRVAAAYRHALGPSIAVVPDSETA